jgi:hypothetical protein
MVWPTYPVACICLPLANVGLFSGAAACHVPPSSGGAGFFFRVPGASSRLIPAGPACLRPDIRIDSKAAEPRRGVRRGRKRLLRNSIFPKMW